MTVIAFVGAQGSGTGNPDTHSTPGDIDTTGANRIFVITTNATSIGLPPFTDSKGNSYTQLTQYSNGGAGGPTLAIFYSQDSPTVGAGHSWAVTGSNINASIAVLAVDSSVNSPFDTGTDFGNTANASTIQPSSPCVPNFNNEIIICGCASSNTATPSIDSSFLTAINMPGVSGIAYGLALFYQIQTTATSKQPTVTYGGSTPLLAIAIAAFKETAALAAGKSAAFIFG